MIVAVCLDMIKECVALQATRGEAEAEHSCQTLLLLIYTSTFVVVPLHLGMTEGCVLCRQHEEELRQSRQECWTLQQDLAALREKQAGLKTAMEDRRKDVVSYKVQPVMLARLVITNPIS